jgi:galactose-1-phosphate uridylyltransferase
MFNLSTHPHRHYNPLSREWVLVSPHRTQRPWQGQVEQAAPEQRPAYDAQCDLCPGNQRAAGARNPAYQGTFVCTNNYAALLLDKPDGTFECGAGGAHEGTPLLRAVSERGTERVVYFSPRHDNLFQVSFPYSMGFHSGRPTARRNRSDSCTRTSTRRCCGRPQCASLWSASSCWPSRSATSRPSGCASCRRSITDIECDKMTG